MACLILENEEYSPDSEGYSYYDFNPNDESSLRAIELALSHRRKNGDTAKEYLSELCSTSLNEPVTAEKRMFPEWIRSLFSSLKSTGKKLTSHRCSNNHLSLPKNPAGRNRKHSFT